MKQTPSFSMDIKGIDSEQNRIIGVVRLNSYGKKNNVKGICGYFVANEYRDMFPFDRNSLFFYGNTFQLSLNYMEESERKEIGSAIHSRELIESKFSREQL